MKLDVHAHFLPSEYREAAIAAGHARPDGFPFLPDWDADEHVAMMDRVGIERSYLSISSPGVHFGDDAAAMMLARSVNDAGRRAVEAHPDRFGLFAALPLPDVDGAIAELDRCVGHLGVDGVALLTNTGGVYVGDPRFEPLYAELDRRHARVFLHPTSAPCWELTSFSRPRPMLEFLFDTTRAVVDLVLNGIVARYPHVEFIVPHGGATLPLVADRVATISRIVSGVDPATDVLHDLGRLHYDLAGYPLPRQLDALLTIATLDRLHYGSDHPFTPEFAVAAAADALDAVESLDGSRLVDRLRVNTARLFGERARHGLASPGDA